MIHQAIEGQVTWLSGVSQVDIPHPWPSSITIRLRSRGIGIEPRNVVGAVPLLNGDTIQILPKIGRVNFFHLFIIAGGLQRELRREFQEFVSYLLDDESNIDSLVARQLHLAIMDILRLSPQIGRVNRRHKGSFALGRLDAKATAFNIAIRRQEPIVFCHRERTYDIPENRVLTEAILRAFPLLPEQDRDYLAPIYNRWLSRFPRSGNLMVDLEWIGCRFGLMQYGGARDYYRKALMLAQVVLGNSGIGLEGASVIEGDSVLLNTANVYERYLLNVIARAHSEAGYVVSKGNAWTISLYTDGSREIIPDIVVSHSGSVRLIADAKYKEPDSSDHYQMYTYLHVMGVKAGLLLAPLFNGDEVVSRKFTSTDGKTVWEIYLPMSNLPATEDFLACLVREFGT